MAQHIQWYPGHMVKAKRLVSEHLAMVDVVVELLDARIPLSSRNPDISELIGTKPHLVVLMKTDLADPGETREWSRILRDQGSSVLAVAAPSGEGLSRLPQMASALAGPALERWRSKGRLPRAPRLMIVGIPNVGKSTLINRLVGENRLRVADRPGVTRQQQWVRIRGDLDLLDMPGILMPKIGDQLVGLKLAATGAISDAVFDLEMVASNLLTILSQSYPELLCRRYRLDSLPAEDNLLLEAIGSHRGALVSGGRVDTLRAAQHLLDEFRAGRIGRISLDHAV